jgi:hypothetical protein
MAFSIVGANPATKDIHLTGKLEILVDSLLDLDNLPSDAPAGSVAYTADLGQIWIKSNAGVWTAAQIGGS